MKGEAWEALEREKARTQAVKAGILKKHGLEEAESTATVVLEKPPAPVANLTAEQLRTFEVKRALHRKLGLADPEPPKPIAVTRREKQSQIKRKGGTVFPAAWDNPDGPRITVKALSATPPQVSPKTAPEQKQLSTKIAQVEAFDFDGLEEIPPGFGAVPATDTSLFGLATLLTEAYGHDWFLWEPETLWAELAEQNAAPEALDGLLAFALCMVSDAPWNEWPVTEKVVIAFNERVPQFALREHVSPAELAHAVMLMRNLRMVEWAPEVLAWMAAICHHHGLVWLPPPLDVAQEEIDRLNRNLDLAKNVQEFWSAIDDDELADFPFQETPVGVQLARLTAMKLYCRAMGSA